MSSRLMLFSFAAPLLLLAGLSGCANSEKIAELGCSEQQQSTWRYPSNWLRYSLSTQEAQATIEADLGATISEMEKNAITRIHTEAWQTMHEEAEAGGELWLMDAPPQTLGPRGIVLIRNCEMVATLITLES